MLDIIRQTLINYAPAFATAFAYIICTFKCIAILTKINDENSLGEIKISLKQVIRDNTDLKCENSMLRQTNKELEDKINQIYDFIKENKETVIEEEKAPNIEKLEV